MVAALLRATCRVGDLAASSHLVEDLGMEFLGARRGGGLGEGWFGFRCMAIGREEVKVTWKALGSFSVG